MTQEQANLISEVMEQNIQAAVNRTTLGPPDNRGANGCGQGKSYGESGAGAGPGMMQRFGRSTG
jgi:hypothetical protein